MILKYLKIIIILFSIIIIGISCKNNNENNLTITPVGFSEKTMVVELVFKDEKDIDLNKIKSVIKDDSIHTDSFYQWKNHVAIFDKINDTGKLKHYIEEAFPSIQLNFYANPFYEFNRTHCDSLNMAKACDNILLTADLVDDTAMQNQYLNYHATQFEKWPQVSKGFCNANFQQLLVYKNGRQLMLVISIPKGQSFDKLNPKTTLNNPKVKDWNNIMKKYQRGIEGTKKGETWVFFKPVMQAESVKPKAKS